MKLNINNLKIFNKKTYLIKCLKLKINSKRTRKLQD